MDKESLRFLKTVYKFLALIKPPYFDVIEIGKRLAQWLLGLPQ